MHRTSPDTLRFLSSAITGREIPCLARTRHRLLLPVPSTSAARSHAALQHHHYQRRHKSAAAAAPEAPTSSDPQISTDTSQDPAEATRNDLGPPTPYALFPCSLPQGPPPTGPFTPDLHRLRAEFLSLQAAAHPDRHPHSATARRQAQVQSAAINDAYRVLRSPLARAVWLLEQRGVGVGEETGLGTGGAGEGGGFGAEGKDQEERDGEKELLMQVLELREQIEDAADEHEIVALKRENEDRIERSVKVLEDAFGRDELARARAEVIRLKYWDSIRERLESWEHGGGFAGR